MTQTLNTTRKDRASFEGRVALTLIGLLGVLPFIQWKHYYPITDFYTEWVAALLGFSAVIFYFRMLSELPVIATVPLLMIALVWLQYGIGLIDYAEHAALISLYLLWGALLITLGHAISRTIGLDRVVRSSAWFILVGGILSGIAAIMQHYRIPSFIDHFITPDASATVYGNLAQQNHFSDYVSIAIASLLYLVASKRLARIAALPIGAFLLFVLALSGSRSAWLYLAALSVLGAITGKKEQNSVLLYSALLLIPAFLVMQFLPHLHLISGHGAVTSGQRLLAKDSGIRLYLWREAWMMFRNAPILGVGFGQFAWHHFQYGPYFNDDRITGLYSNSHDLIMNLLAETGILGTLIVVGGIFLWARRIDMLWDSNALWIFSLLSVFALHSLDEYPLWYAQFFGLCMLLMGMAESRALRIPFFQATLAFILVLGSYFLVGLMRDYRELEGLLFPAYQSGKPPLAPAVLYDRLSHFREGTLLRPYVDFPMADMMRIDSVDLDKKLALSQRVVRYSPSGMTVYRGAAFLALAGMKKQAKEEVERASCSDPDLLIEAGKLYLSLAKSEPKAFMPLVVEVGYRIREREVKKSE
jgi:O-antigen ligase